MNNELVGILLEDDNEISKNISLYMNKYTDLSIIQTTTCEQFKLETMANNKIVYAIVDIQLPDGDGLETLRFLKLNQPHVKIFIITGLKNEKLIEMAFEEHLVDDFIEKPFTMSNLLSRIKRRVPEIRTNKQHIINDYYLSVKSGTIENPKNNISIKIEPAVAKCLQLLIENKGNCVSREIISQKVLNKEYMGGRNIDVIIRKIRSVFKTLNINENELSISNVRINGYILKS